MWGLAREGPANQEKRVGPAEKSIWRAAHLPKTQKSKNCGLERKYASQLWETKGRKKKREGMGRTKSVNVELIRGRGRRWNPAPAPTLAPQPSGHLADAPLGRQPLLPSPLPPCQCHGHCAPGHSSSVSSRGSLSRSLQLVLGTGQLSRPRALGNSDQRVLKVGPWKLRMSSNPSVTRIGFHQHLVLSASLAALLSSGLTLGEGQREDLRKA